MTVLWRSRIAAVGAERHPFPLARAGDLIRLAEAGLLPLHEDTGELILLESPVGIELWTAVGIHFCPPGFHHQNGSIWKHLVRRRRRVGCRGFSIAIDNPDGSIVWAIKDIELL